MSKLNFGLIGYPLGHSLSPIIHRRLFDLSGISEDKADYKLFEIEPQNLDGSYDFLNSLEGFNITIPHKIAIMPYCREIDAQAQSLGAINCVYKKKGYNTDVYGFLKSLEILGFTVTDKSNICVLGFGGAGKMAVNALINLGANVTAAARNPEKIDADCKTMTIEKLSGEFDLIINTTPLGMYPRVDISPIDFIKIRAEYVFDMIFNPKKTLLIEKAEKIGAKTLSGLHMLVRQAARAHKIWHGGEYTESEINEIVSELSQKLTE